MQGFNDEYSNILKLPFNEIINDYKIIYIGGKIIEILNYVKIIKYNENLIILKAKDNEINIEGFDLQIKELCKKDIVIVGSINKIYLSREYKNNEKKNK